MNILNKFITDNYDDIMLMAKKICKSNQDWEELGHFCIEKFMVHERAEELIKANRAKQFISGIMHRSFWSETSEYFRDIKQKNKMIFNGWDLQKNKYFDDIEDQDYDYEKERIITLIYTILEEMVIMGKDKDQWHRATLFQKWLEVPNFSKLERMMGVPRTSIKRSVEECKTYIQQELKNRGIDYEL